MIHKSVLLHCPPAMAFALFTEQASAWWPESRRHTDDPNSTIRFEPNGRFWERAQDGEEVDLGRVRTWEPPHRLVLDFYIGTDAAHPTEVEVAFQPEAEGTRVTIDHRPLPGTQELWNMRAPKFAASWDAVLESLVAAE